jgi:Zn finger protein HypA/HybF involved in hydrogenase expression
MEVKDLTFLCADCGAYLEAPDIEKVKSEPEILAPFILQCPECSGTKFEVYTVRKY